MPSAVPEPATWIMMLAGLAGLGFIARHRTVASGIASRKYENRILPISQSGLNRNNLLSLHS
jgi:hypothetical protein